MIIGEVKYDNVDFDLTPVDIRSGIMCDTETPLNTREISGVNVR